MATSTYAPLSTRNACGQSPSSPQTTPGSSPANRYEPLLAELTTRLGQAPDVVFIAFPQFAGNEWIKVGRAGIDDSDRSTEREAAALVGRAAASLPPADACSCADLAPGHPLLASLPEPEPPRSLLDDLTVVEVAALPWPHKPFRCRHAARFEQLAKIYPSNTGGAGERWTASLTDDDVSACRYHQLDWAAAAGTAVEIFEKTAMSGDAIEDEIEARNAGAEMSEAILSFFRDPIDWAPGTPYVSNGQHRLCAVRFSGASRCVVDTGGVSHPPAGG